MMDVVVLGGGPGGYVAAIRSAQRGLKTAVVEMDNVGGVCLNWGCIPTKAIIKSVHTLHDINSASGLGIDCSVNSVSMPDIIKRSRLVSSRLTKGVDFLLKKNKVTVIKGRGKLISSTEMLIEGNEDINKIESKNFVLATGSRPRDARWLGIDKEQIISSRQALELDVLPESIAIIGAGAIGVEFAYIYNGLGVDVTLIEALPEILPANDSDIKKEITRALKKKKIKIMTAAMVSKIDKCEKSVKLTIKTEKGDKELEVDKVLASIGVQSNLENIGLEELGVKTDKGFVLVDENQQTNVAGVYAIGDIAGNPCLAHKASKEGLIAIDAISGHKVNALNKYAIPACIYCEPQVAAVGYTQEMAEKENLDITISKVMYRAIGKAIAAEEAEGFVKLISLKENGEIIGAHIVGAQATELIAEMGVAISNGLTVHNIAETIHAHPTLSEILMEVSEMATGEAIHA